MFRSLRAFFLNQVRKASRRKALYVRALATWLIGLFILSFIPVGYDFRYQLRGQQTHEDIVIITVSESAWLQYQGENRNLIRPLKEISNLADSFFWSPSFWYRLIYKILELNPDRISISFFFGDSVRDTSLLPEQKAVFADHRLIWASSLDNEGRILFAKFSDNLGTNTGVLDLKSDADGVFRKIQNRFAHIPNLALKSARQSHLYPLAPIFTRGEQVLNFRGPTGTFESYSFEQVLNGDLPEGALKGRTVVIGAVDSAGHVYNTPLGVMSRAEILANAIDNFNQARWVRTWPSVIYASLLLLLCFLSVWIMLRYPHTVAFVFLVWIGLAWTTFSIWIFDTYYVWTPILAPITQLAVAFMVFLSYQLTMKENLSWRLEQEKKYLFEVEQLKNNFMSLVSHDLKTPIAKIQAIVDHILALQKDEALKSDLLALRQESAELHRYIQSILKLIQVEARDLKLNLQAEDLNEIIETVVGHLQPLARQKEIHLGLQLEPLFSIELDPILIREVILNLVENAIKYTPKNGQVLVTSSEVDDWVIFNVKDTGLGIEPHEIDKIWDKFYRLGKNPEVKGSGLGLYLVKYFIELHGGQVFVKSELGVGTEIGFRLPLST